jgi:hypothetical protein
VARSLRNSKVDDFEPKRKNPIGLLNDSNLDSDLKTLLIGNKTSGLELSETETKINTDLHIEQVIGNIKTTGGIYMNDTEPLVLNNNSENFFAGSTYFVADSGSGYVTLDLYVGNEQFIQFKQLNVGEETITAYSSNILIEAGQKLIFDASDSQDYITLNDSDNDLEFYVENTKVFELAGDGNILLKNNTTIDATTDDIIDFSTALSATNLIVDATDKVLLDGASGHTYLTETSDDILDFYVGGDATLRIDESTSRLSIPATWGLYFDGSTHTYITESSDDVLDIYVGGDKMLSLDESVDTGVTSLLGTLKIAEQADASADTVGYGQLWVQTGSRCELSYTDEGGQDIIGIGKYHYETKVIGYYASATAIYLPMTGYIIEGTSTTGRNEYQGFVTPYNCTIEKVTFRSEVAQDGNISFRVLEADDGTEIPGTTHFRKETAVDIADDTYQELDMTSPSTGSDYSPLTKGKCYQFYLSTPSISYDTNITIVFKWDILS